MKLFQSRIFIFCILILIILQYSPIIWNNVSTNGLDSSILPQDHKFKVYSTDTSVNPIFIDNSNQNFNWSKTCSENFWCSGSGVPSDPFIIENIFIDGLNTQDPLLIQNSNEFFIIRNSTFVNSPEFDSIDYRGGIKLANVQNGELINNTIYSSQKNGIFLFSSSSINITENFIFQNSYGIYLYLSSNNIINNNIIYSNSIGLSLEFSSNFNTIKNDILFDNTEVFC